MHGNSPGDILNCIDLIFYRIGPVIESAYVVIMGGTLSYCFILSRISQELERNARSIIGNIWSMTRIDQEVTVDL